MEKLSVGDPKIIAVLDQIRDLHRNPLLHPEDSLTVDEAIDLFGIVRSAIGAMLRKIPMPELKLTSPPSAVEILTGQKSAEEQSV